MTITQYPWKSWTLGHFSCFCALPLWEHVTVRWCLQGHCCWVRFWIVLVIFTASKSTPVLFSVIFHPLLIIYCRKLPCWRPYFAPQQTDVYVWWLFTNDRHPGPWYLCVCLFTERSLWTTFVPCFREQKRCCDPLFSSLKLQFYFEYMVSSVRVHTDIFKKLRLKNRAN